MIVQSCCRNKVLLSYEGVWAAATNTTHDLRWVRARANAVARQQKAFSTPGARISTPVRESRGVINVEIRLFIFLVNICRELAANRAAIRMLMNHERSHLAPLEDAMRTYLGRLGTDLDGRFSNPAPTLQAIHDDIQGRRDPIFDAMAGSIEAFDREDWPALHRALLRVDVPATLRTSLG